MDPLSPDPEESRTLPVRRGSKTAHGLPAPAAGNEAAPPAPDTATPPEASTLSLRPSTPLASLVPPRPPVQDPSTPGDIRTVALRPGGASLSSQPPAAPPEGSTVSIRQVQAARPIVGAGAAPLPPDVKLPEGATVSIRQVLELREKLQASWDAPTEVDDSAGTTTLPVKPKQEPGERPALYPAAQPPAVSAPPATDKPAKRSGDVPVDPAHLCPHCGQKLISPMSLGLCPGCGYCRSLEEGKDKVAPPPEVKAERLSLFGLVEFCMLLAWVPGWAWLMAGGIVLIVLETIYARHSLPVDSPTLAWWGTIQFSVGILSLIGAHVWALFRLAPQDGRVGPFDLVALSLRVWGKVVEALPDTSTQLVVGSLGGVSAIAALFLCGIPFAGLDTPSDGLITRELRTALDNLKRVERDALVTEAARDFSSRPKPPPNSAPDNRNDNRPTEKVAVVGYRLNDDGSVVEVALATVRDGTVHYAGVVRVKATEILQSLKLMERESAPEGTSDPDTVWVKPGSSVEVHHSGVSGDGKLQQPNFKRVLQDD